MTDPATAPAPLPARLCVVVGATGAMGSVITERLVARGLRVVAVGRDVDALEKLVQGRTESIVACPADIADDEAIETIRAAVDEPVLLALFAAGLPVRGSADTIEPGLLATAANIKVAGPVRLLRAVREHLVDGSRFVAIAGSLGLEPGPLDAGPGTANAALLNLMHQISALYGPKGVAAITVAPGPIDTPRLREFARVQSAETGTPIEQIWQRFVDKTSLGRLPTLPEIAWLIETLLAPEAAILHGGVINADAGTRHSVH